MTNPRMLVSKDPGILYFTLFRNDRDIEGSWQNPNVPLLIFSDNLLGGASLSNHGGPVGSGMPVELLFWGSWWLTPDGANRRALIETRTHQLLDSVYFSELAQYGVNPPHWRGSLVVTAPNPPGAFNSQDDTKKVPDLIDDLIDDDVFPDPDDEMIAFIVFMPEGFTETIKENGAHTFDYNYTFPTDYDYYWVAWVRSFGDIPADDPKDNDPEDTLRTMGHELVEMFTDGQLNAWYAGSGKSTVEIGDAGATPVTKEKQTAWVNGVRVQAYWSNAANATVIPIDRDYAARISGVANQDGYHIINRGEFSPDPSYTRFCQFVAECCPPAQQFTYTLAGYDETVRLHVDTRRYRQPVFNWSIEGVAVSGAGSLTVNVIAQQFNGRTSSYTPTDVVISYTVNGNAIQLNQVGSYLNFDLTVTCAVTDGSIVGNLKVNVIARPTVDVGFAGAVLNLDSNYTAWRDACDKAVSDMFKNVGHGGISQRPKPGETVIIDPGILNELPAFARLSQYQAAQNVVYLSRMAAAVMPPEAAQAYAMFLAADVPVLMDALRGQSGSQVPQTDSNSVDSTTN